MPEPYGSHLILALTYDIVTKNQYSTVWAEAIMGMDPELCQAPFLTLH